MVEQDEILKIMSYSSHFYDLISYTDAKETGFLVFRFRMIKLQVQI